MSKAKIIWVTVSAILIVGGMMMALAALAMLDFDFAKLTTESATVEQTYTVTDVFHSIAVDVDTDNIRFALSDDGTCRVQCRETDKRTYAVTVQNDCLTVDVVDHRRWYDHIGIFIYNETNALTVYLPQTTYASLTVETDTSDVSTDSGLAFERASVDTDTGDVTWYATVTDLLSLSSDTGHIQADGMTVGALLLETDTGDITAQAVTVFQRCAIECDTGEIRLTDMDCGAMEVQSTTGDITLADTVVSGELCVTSSTGDVRFERSNGWEMRVVTGTGDVTGTLLTDKFFLVETSTGHVDVPQCTVGGRCEIITNTGDIILDIVK